MPLFNHKRAHLSIVPETMIKEKTKDRKKLSSNKNWMNRFFFFFFNFYDITITEKQRLIKY